MLADWQRGGGGVAGLPSRLPATDTFVQGRLDPYLGDQLRGRHPSLAPALAALSAELLADRCCLVHGDYSPKNVLVGERGSVWLLDFEICHFGHPAFDPAFMAHPPVAKVPAHCRGRPAASSPWPRISGTHTETASAAG